MVGNMRNLLYTEWGSLWKFYKGQPLDYIKDYYGVKVGLYFAWLGFYTYMLSFASVVGILCFIYGCLTVYQNQPRYSLLSQAISCIRMFLACVQDIASTAMQFH